ncbi:MAG: NIPSNAP family protein [Verrucomicrobiia bacterium]
MKPIIHSCCLALLSLVLVFTATAGQAADTRCFEMRTYYAAPGKLDAVQARFRDYTCKCFEKHGMTNIGYWLPLENPDNKLVYVLAFPSREAATASWKAFMADPDRQAYFKKTEANGKILDKIESVFLKATDFSPEVKPCCAAAPRTFELRTYKASGKNLPNLLARFRNHTCTLFEKHGVTNVAYWTPADEKKGASDTLIYIVAHKSKEAGAESFKAFRADPEWVKVKADSEKAAGGSLTIKDGVKSVLMQPTDFSPMK